MEKTEKRVNKEQAFSNISLKSFVTVVLVLAVILTVSAGLSYGIPQGSFSRDAD